MNMGEAYAALPAKGAWMMLVRAALRGPAAGRDRARVRLLWMPGGRDAYVRAVLQADPAWQVRPTRIPKLDASLRRWVDRKRGAK